MAEPGELFQIDGYAVSASIITGTDNDGVAHRMMTAEVELSDTGAKLTIGLVRTLEVARLLRADLDKFITNLDAAQDAELAAMLGDGDGSLPRPTQGR